MLFLAATGWAGLACSIFIAGAIFISAILSVTEAASVIAHRWHYPSHPRCPAWSCWRCNPRA